MKKRQLPALLLSVAVCSGVGTFAQAPPENAQTGQATAPNSTTLRVRGTIEKYDAATHTLSLSTSSGTMQFPVSSTARIRQGWRRIDASALEKLSGFHAVLRYSQSDANKTVESVHVFGSESERTQR